MDSSEELSLDPGDWASFRRLAHHALDDALDFVKQVRERPVWQPTPCEVRENLSTSLPVKGTPIEEVYAEFKSQILPFPTGNIHPRFFGWVHGSGQAGNLISEMMGAAMNCNCGGRDHVAIDVERTVIDWCRQLFGFPETASGLIVSGTSMATLIALGAARKRLEPAVRTQGLESDGGRSIVYTSTEVHECAVKALDILGFGSSSLRKIPTKCDLSIDAAALSRAIAQDRANGLRPWCCIGCVGTVNTGAIDNLDQLARICRKEGLWFHVDGAFGGLCMTSERLRGRLSGIEKADSLAFDFHKWAHVQYDAGCVLVRDGDVHRAAYSMRPSYLQHLPRGLAGGRDWPCDYGLELSRGFRALKVWFALKEHGTERIGKLIEQNCDQAQYLARRLLAEDGFELVAPVSLNIVCFRAIGAALDDLATDKFNEDLVADIQLSGVAAPSTCRIDGRLAIRVNITNHRTRYSDLDVFVDELLKVYRVRRYLA